jgi:hypothetical protein
MLTVVSGRPFGVINDLTNIMARFTATSYGVGLRRRDLRLVGPEGGDGTRQRVACGAHPAKSSRSQSI